MYKRESRRRPLMITTGLGTVSTTNSTNAGNRRRNRPATYRRQSTHDGTEAEQVCTLLVTFMHVFSTIIDTRNLRLQVARRLSTKTMSLSLAQSPVLLSRQDIRIGLQTRESIWNRRNVPDAKRRPKTDLLLIKVSLRRKNRHLLT